MSWIRALDESFDRDVTFCYSVARESDALYLDEIGAAAAAHPTLRPRVVDSGRDGYLTAKQAANGITSEADVSVYMCGPPAMMTGFLRVSGSWVSRPAGSAGSSSAFADANSAAENSPGEELVVTQCAAKGAATGPGDCNLTSMQSIWIQRGFPQDFRL